MNIDWGGGETIRHGFFCCYDSCGWDNVPQAQLVFPQHWSKKLMTDHYDSVNHLLFMHQLKHSLLGEYQVPCYKS